MTRHGNIRHGLSRTKNSEYQTWEALRQRCLNPNNPRYKYYGGRGIKVCERWSNFQNFLTDMGVRPKGLTLDRRDNDGNYEPDNCRWVTYKEQRANQRYPICWFFGYNKNTGEWFESNNQHETARKLGLNQGNISACLHGKEKIHHGWTLQWL